MIKKDIVKLLLKNGVNLSESNLNKKTKKDLEVLLNGSSIIDTGPSIINNQTFPSATYSAYFINGDKDEFEYSIIDDILKQSNEPIEVVNYIIDLSRIDKRVAMLSLDMYNSDNAMWEKLKETINSNQVSKVTHLKDLIKSFRNYIKVADVERKRHGEIMSPIDELVLPMVNTVPDDFWENPDHKILDSSAGIGTFLIVCATKLMNGLKSWEPDSEKRFKHIVENMLYYGELQSRNAFLWLCAIDPQNDYKTNTYWGSYLDDKFDFHMKNVWKLDGFDLIIQNPPYQEQKPGFTKTQPLWHLFVQKSLKLVNEDKYMVMVHPGGWRNVAGVFKETQNLLKNRQMLYLKLHSFKKGQELFDAAITFDYYCVINKKNNAFLTKVLFEDDTKFDVDISKLEFIPNESFYEISKLIAKNGEERVALLGDSSYHTQHTEYMSKIQMGNCINPCIYTIKSPDNGNIPTFWYSSKKTKHFGIPKVVWASGASGVFVDKIGEYGLTQFAYAIIDDVDNLEGIKHALQSERFIRNIMGFKHSLGDKYNRKIIATFRKDFWKEFINDKACSYKKEKN